LIKLAINDANVKAKFIAETSGRQLDKILEIKYGTFDSWGFVSYQDYDDLNPIRRDGILKWEDLILRR